TEGFPERSETLTVMKRKLAVPRAAGTVAWFSFEELCARPLSAVDYLALAERFGAMIVEGIPRLSPRQRNEAQRFHILIDTLCALTGLSGAHGASVLGGAQVPEDLLVRFGTGPHRSAGVVAQGTEAPRRRDRARSSDPSP